MGDANRPVRVPDGLEVKTSPKSVKADCHYNHAGLHFVMVYRVVEEGYRVADLKVAFLRPSDYTQRGRNTEATTVKFSFGGEKFISLLPKPINLHIPTKPRAKRATQPRGQKGKPQQPPGKKPPRPKK